MLLDALASLLPGCPLTAPQPGSTSWARLPAGSPADLIIRAAPRCGLPIADFHASG